MLWTHIMENSNKKGRAKIRWPFRNSEIVHSFLVGKIKKPRPPKIRNKGHHFRKVNSNTPSVPSKKSTPKTSITAPLYQPFVHVHIKVRVKLFQL